MIDLLLFMAPQGQDPASGFTSTIIMFGLMFLILYFMIIRPQRKRQQERQKMLDGLKKGDKVITSGGIHGTIAGLDDKIAVVEIADKIKVKVERGSIAGVTKESEPEKK